MSSFEPGTIDIDTCKFVGLTQETFIDLDTKLI